MYQFLKDFKGEHNDQDIYIIGSGNSMSFMPFSFFDNKITIGINTMYKHYNCDYIVLKDIRNPRAMVQHLQACEKSRSKLITVSQHEGKSHKFKTKHNYIIAPVGDWEGFVDLKLIDTDIMVNSHSTITTTIHCAYYMGAKNIILCGIDCGMLDGISNMNKYYTKKVSETQNIPMSHPYHELNVKAMRDALKERNCNVVSLNPFINIGLEGHEFTKYPISKKDMWAGEINDINL